jgi:hypothetical protein
MAFIFFGKPLVFWLGLITLASLAYQIHLGFGLAHGHPEFFRRHRANAMVLICLVTIHLILGLLLYF